MRRRRFLKTTPTVGLVGLAGCGSDSGDSPSVSENRTTTREATTQEPDTASFELLNLSYTEMVERGNEVEFSVDVVNTGERAGETTVKFEIGEITCSQRVDLGPGETVTVTCTETVSLAEGTYELVVLESATSASRIGELAVDTRVLDLPWTQLPGPPGGPVKDIAVAPTDENYLYAQTATAGLYASSDGGQSWIQGPEAYHHGKQIEVNPHDPQEVRNAGGERTIDAGARWFGESADHEDRRFPRSVSVLNDIAFDPFEEEILYASDEKGLYRTVDGGLNWERVDVGVETADDIVNRVAVAPEAEGVVFAGYYRDATVVRSDDHGTTWEEVVSGDDIPSGRLRGLVAERSGEAAYACVDHRGVYRVGDGAPELLGPEVPNPRGPYFLFYDGPTLSADDERLYFHAFSLEEGEDQFDMWETIQLYEYDRVADRMRTLDVPENPGSVTAHPTDPDTLYFGGWSWVWRSDDRGATWDALSNEFVDRYLSTVGTNPDRPGTVVPGSICSSGVWTSHDHGQTYSWKRSGLSPFLEKSSDRHYEEHYAMRSAAGGNRFYVTTAAGLLVSEDDGDTWRLETGVPGYDTHGLDHYHGLGVDPKDPMRVYIGTGLGRHGQTNQNKNPEPPTDRPTRVWRSTDGAETWQEVTTGFPSEERTVVKDILVSRADSDVVYIGTHASGHLAVATGDNAGTGFGLFRSTNAGDEWEQLSTPFLNVHSITQDAGDPGTIYVSTPEGVYRSKERGQQWEQTLQHPTKGLLAHPGKPGVLFAGARKYQNYWDLLVSDDRGDTWGEGNLTIQIGTEPDAREYDGVDTNADYRGGGGGVIMDLAFDEADSHLLAATRGASLWQGSVDSVLSDSG